LPLSQNLPSIIKKEEISAVKYFTTIPHPDIGGEKKIKRHKRWLQALQLLSTPIEIIKGKFKRIDKTCKASCRQKYVDYIEKRTDVNISVEMVGDAFLNNFDTAYLISGDSDFVPVIKYLQSHFKDKYFIVFCPPGRFSKELKDIANKTIHLRVEDFEPFILPEKIDRPGMPPLTKPENWIRAKHKWIRAYSGRPFDTRKNGKRGI